MTPVATVLIPTHDHGATLEHAVASALAQTVADLEVLVVGDGMPEQAARVARAVAAADPRVRLLEFPKGPRHGEPHRHTALLQARGRHVLYLSDDDLWLPDHAATLIGLLEAGADFAAARQAARLGDGRWALAPVDLAMASHRDAMRGGHNRVGLTEAGHTLAAYRRLPHGWRAAPPDVPTDLHMWRQWLDQPWARFASAAVPTALHFPSHERRAMSAQERVDELAGHRAVLTDPAARIAWLEQLLAGDFPRTAWLEANWREQGEWLRNRDAALAWHVERLAEATEALAWYREREAAAPEA